MHIELGIMIFLRCLLRDMCVVVEMLPKGKLKDSHALSSTSI
jgi:hypothetical protein